MSNTRETCIHCDRPIKTRGLCNAHYVEFRRAFESLPLDERDEFETKAVEAGKILPSSTGKPRSENIFAKLAREVHERHSHYLVDKDAIDEGIKQSRAKIDRPAKKPAKKKIPKRSAQ